MEESAFVSRRDYFIGTAVAGLIVAEWESLRRGGYNNEERREIIAGAAVALAEELLSASYER